MGSEGADAVPAGPPNHFANSGDDQPNSEIPRLDAEAAALGYWVSRSSHSVVDRGSSEALTTSNNLEQVGHSFGLNTPCIAHSECCGQWMWSVVLTFVLQPFVQHTESVPGDDICERRRLCVSRVFLVVSLFIFNIVSG